MKLDLKVYYVGCGTDVYGRITNVVNIEQNNGDIIVTSDDGSRWAIRLKYVTSILINNQERG